MAIPHQRPVAAHAHAQAHPYRPAQHGSAVPKHGQQQQQQQQQQPAHAQVHHAQHQQRISAHTPDAALLHEGPRNRLWLSLRSGIDAEVDYALPLLVLASHDRLDAFNLDRWVDPVQALREWPDKWVDDLEREAAYRQLQAGPSASSSASDSTSGSSEALGAVPAWTRSPTTELRAAFSLQIFRNASFSDRNVAELVKARFGSFLDRFFALPTNFLVELATRSPEPIQHILVILQNISPRLGVDASILHVLGTVLPTLAMNLADAGMLLFLLPILIRAFSSPALSLLPAPEGFVQHVLYFLTLSPPAPLLDYVLDLLAVLATSPSHARTILADPSFPGHLKALTLLLEHGARAENALWNPAGPFRAMPVPNPASVDVMARGASARRLTERESDRERMEGSGGAGVFREVGDKQPELPLSLKTELYAMNEPKRSITWMHESFGYSSDAQVMQVTFWQAYRDFFSHKNVTEQLLSASEVIKNVQIAFPAAQPKMWTDERGESKFVIAGIGFRKGGIELDRFQCQWRGCAQRLGAKNPGELLEHVQKAHLGSTPVSCNWGSCTHSSFTTAHILTHLPLAVAPQVPTTLSMYADQPADILTRAEQTRRPAPLLSAEHPLRFVAKMTRQDAARQPTGAAFLAALAVRGLARNLRAEIEAARPGEMGLSDAQRREKKKHLAEERFGLPIPASVLREEEEEEDEARGPGGASADSDLSEDELERACTAFRAVEDRILEVVNTNFAGLGRYLGDAFGW